jgi:hypothetical protein
MVQQSQDDLTDMISKQRLHAQANSAFLKQTRILPLESNTGFLFRECAHGISQRQTQTPLSLDGGVLGFFRTTPTFFSVSGLHEGLLQTGSPPRLWLRQSDRMDENPPHGLLRLFYLHAPGLTLVTLGTACVPSVRLPPTTWEITCPSKGLRIKTYDAHIFLKQ